MQNKVKKEIDREKVEAAEDLGLAEKLRMAGWGGLTSNETGRIGALVKKLKHGEGDPPREG